MSNAEMLVVTEALTLSGKYDATGEGIDETGLWKGDEEPEKKVAQEHDGGTEDNIEGAQAEDSEEQNLANDKEEHEQGGAQRLKLHKPQRQGQTSGHHEGGGRGWATTRPN